MPRVGSTATSAWGQHVGTLHNLPTWDAAPHSGSRQASDDEGSSGDDGHAGALADSVLREYTARLDGARRSCCANQQAHVKPGVTAATFLVTSLL